MRIGGRAIAAAVGEVDRRLVAGDQAFVAVGGRVGEGAQGRGVLEQAADGVQGHVRQAGIAGAGEQIVAVLPQRRMDVHAGAVVQEDRLGHERGRLAVLAGDVLDDVLVLQHVVGHLDQRSVAHVDLALAAGGDLVMMGLDLEAALDHRQHHLGAHIVQGVGRRTGEIAFLVAELVAEVGLLVAAGVPGAFDAVEEVIAGMLRLVVANVVEDEELHFRAEIGGVGDAGRLHVVDGLAGDVARVARVVLAWSADPGCCRSSLACVSLQNGSMKAVSGTGTTSMSDSLMASQPRMLEPSKPRPSSKVLFVECLGGDGEVLPQAGKVHEAQIDGPDFLLTDEGEDFFGCHGRDLRYKGGCKAL